MVARARSGDEAGFLALWRSLQPRLLRYLRVLGCDDPDDVASETWLQMVRDLHRFHGDDQDFRRRLFAVGRNRAIDAGRARRRRPCRPVAGGLDILADGQTVEDQVLDGMSARKAIAMLAGLSPGQSLYRCATPYGVKMPGASVSVPGVTAPAVPRLPSCGRAGGFSRFHRASGARVHQGAAG